MIGARIERREDHRLLTGQGKFLDDLDMPGVFEAAFLRSPHGHARILGIDVNAALDLPGVIGVFTGEDIRPMMKPLPAKVAHPDLQEIPRLPMALDAVHHAGEPVAVVVAISRYVAEDAVDLIDVDYEVLPAISSTAAALAPGAPLAHEGARDNIAVHVVQRAGDPDAAIASAPHVLSETFRVTRGGGHSMECRAVAARFDTATGQLVVWDSTQAPHYARNALANLYDMPEDDIRLIAPADVGGGFGPKAQFYGEEAVVPWVAMQLGQPVKWIEDRQENFVAAMMERTQVHRVQVAFDDDGMLLALKDVFEHDQGAYVAGLQVPMITLSTVPGQYKIPNIHTELYSCYTNMVPTSSVRGAGRPQAVVAMERMMDRIAEYLGTDPAEVRRRNLIQPDEFPYKTGLLFRDGSPQSYDSGDYPELLRGVLERAGYDAWRTRQEQVRAQGRLIGIGIACYVEGCGLGPYEGAKARLTNRGEVLVTLAAAPQGQGYETVYAQIASAAMGLDMRYIRVVTGDTGRIPFGQGTFASRITATAGPAVLQACRALRDRIFHTAAIMLKIEGENFIFRGDRVTVPHDESVAVTLQQVTQVANVGKHGITLLRGVQPGLETSSYFAPEQAAYASGTHAAVVEVDPETGRIEILKYVIGHDCGTVINPLLVDGQVLGGFAAGIGNAMYEEQFYDDAAQPLTTSYLDFSLPSSAEVPPVELFHVQSPSPLNPLGAKGAGEGGTIPAPAAIANAVEDALRPFGARINELPVTPSRVIDAIEGGGS
ncbi:MAG TPA: xanthine dehydrogenase family protein molybdopterin-binding subunit [Streptosporangiaceae bacterium]|jgi:carbon-monoxide dehydrogenase large subunit|nr:xanthine dehydrogenase family protein molybdopterin-binding subunit [Streptosporangiaceae bacterium]